MSFAKLSAEQKGYSKLLYNEKICIKIYFLDNIISILFVLDKHHTRCFLSKFCDVVHEFTCYLT